MLSCINPFQTFYALLMSAMVLLNSFDFDVITVSNSKFEAGAHYSLKAL
jgi:hypothetical protein